jgi:hypothetical protein
MNKLSKIIKPISSYLSLSSNNTNELGVLDLPFNDNNTIYTATRVVTESTYVVDSLPTYAAEFHNYSGFTHNNLIYPTTQIVDLDNKKFESKEDIFLKKLEEIKKTR